MSSLDKHTIIFIKCCLHFLLIFMKIVAVIAGTTVVVGSILLCVDLITMNVVQHSQWRSNVFFSFRQQPIWHEQKTMLKIIIEIEQNGKFVNRLIRSYIWCHNYCAISSRHFHLFIDVNMWYCLNSLCSYNHKLVDNDMAQMKNQERLRQPLFQMKAWYYVC